MNTKATHTPRKVLIKFLLLCLLVAVYFGYLSYKYDIMTGGIASALTWSFFVLCTPVADAGFLLDFPLRLLFGVRMVFSEMAVWTIAITLNSISLGYFPQYYETTVLTRLLHQILTHPYPYWAVILLSCAGTFLSIKFGDEVMDIIRHRDKTLLHSRHLKYGVILVGSFLLMVFGYYELIASLGIDKLL